MTSETDADPASSLGQQVSVGQEACRVPALIQSGLLTCKNLLTI